MSDRDPPGDDFVARLRRDEESAWQDFSAELAAKLRCRALPPEVDLDDLVVEVISRLWLKGLGAISDRRHALAYAFGMAWRLAWRYASAARRAALLPKEVADTHGESPDAWAELEDLLGDVWNRLNETQRRIVDEVLARPVSAGPLSAPERKRRSR